MKISMSAKRILFHRDLSPLDRFMIAFTSLLDRQKIKYVIVSGYVAIMFGRNRASEDIDIITQKISYGKFKSLWKACREFMCINTSKVSDAFHEYLLQGHSLRFSKKGTFIPNVEFKFPKVDLDLWTLSERREVLLNGNRIYISPLELQIPFKLFLGSKKDIEDARFLYRVFKDRLDIPLLKEFNRKLKIDAEFNRYINENSQNRP